VERDRILDGSRVRAGHRLLALPSSGPHSNGYSLIRKVLERSGTDPADPLGDGTLGDALLAPTRIYVRPVLELLAQGGIDALAHITGGGITDNVVRVVPDGLGIEVQRDAWEWPRVFRWLQRAGDIEQGEMLRTFNCGIGMVLLVAADRAGAVAEQARAIGESCLDIGCVVAADDGTDRVRYR
jgi:phosphoribosylformylglycinamidine cyclo-ligase